MTCRGGSIYTMFLDGRQIHILQLQWAAWHSLGDYSLKTVPLPRGWTLICWSPAMDGKSPSFEYCANKLQAAEATSKNCWIFLGLKTNYPTNKQMSINNNRNPQNH